MRRNLKLILIVTSIVGAFIAFRTLSSPNRILRHALHVERLPSSITNIQMVSSGFTDEIHRFYFEIAARDFPALLAGRNFRPIGNGGIFETRTIHDFPSISFAARWQYKWDAEGAHCEIHANEEKTRVIVIFAAD